jgi:hypothetical protein
MAKVSIWAAAGLPDRRRARTLAGTSLAGRAGAAEGVAGSTLARGGAGSIKRAGMIFSVVFDIEG